GIYQTQHGSTVLALRHIPPSYGHLTLASEIGTGGAHATGGGWLGVRARAGTWAAVRPGCLRPRPRLLHGMEARRARGRDHRRDRSCRPGVSLGAPAVALGTLPAVGLGIALIQAVAGLISARTLWYFAPSLIVNATCGVAFVVSVMMGQPLAALFAADTSAFSPDVMASRLFRNVCSQISMVWAVYLLGGSLARLVALLRGSVAFYLTVYFLTGFPLAAAIMGWSMWYGA